MWRAFWNSDVELAYSPLNAVRWISNWMSSGHCRPISEFFFMVWRSFSLWKSNVNGSRIWIWINLHYESVYTLSLHYESNTARPSTVLLIGNLQEELFNSLSLNAVAQLCNANIVGEHCWLNVVKLIIWFWTLRWPKTSSCRFSINWS